MELAEMTVYLCCTCVFATLLQHPASPIRHLIPSVIVRRAIFGILIGTTLTAIILTPWGQQSGGHLNPAVTWTFYRLRKLEFWDAVFYGIAQFSGATAGVAIATLLLQGAPAQPAIRYSATQPGSHGAGIAFAAEVLISFSLMFVVLIASNSRAVSRYTPYMVGGLYAVFITLEAPLSGMSMNPARTFGPAFLGSYWHGLWIYFLAPTLGMLIAAELFLWLRCGIGPYCAKLHHANHERCVFRHGHRQVDYIPPP